MKLLCSTKDRWPVSSIAYCCQNNAVMQYIVDSCRFNSDSVQYPTMEFDNGGVKVPNKRIDPLISQTYFQKLTGRVTGKWFVSSLQTHNIKSSPPEFGPLSMRNMMNSWIFWG